MEHVDERRIASSCWLPCSYTARLAGRPRRAYVIRLGVWGHSFRWTRPLAQVRLHQGRYDEAQTLAERMVAEARDLDNARGPILGLALLGEVALATGAFAEADRVLTKSAEAVGPYTKDRYKHGQLVMLGLTARGTGRPDEAEQRLRSALSETGTLQ